MRAVACAYLLQHAQDVRTPVTAALSFIENAPRAVEASVH
jgi:hypothetical protein